jgi:hypothetical protein
VTSKMLVLRILDGIVMTFLAVLTLSLVGLPMGWMSRLLHMSTAEFHKFAMFMVIAPMWLMYAIAASDSAP